jgi:hypothetical protein
MRFSSRSVLIASAAALAATTLSGTASADGSDPVLYHHGSVTTPPAPTPGAVCFSSLGAPDTEDFIPSQKFEPKFRRFKSLAAESFRCAGSGTFELTQVNVVGSYFNGPGPADSVTVKIYPDKAGEPDDDTVLCSYPDLTYTNGPSFNVVLPQPCAVASGQTYWLNVRANMAFAQGGQWGWEVTPEQTGPPGDWKNPRDTFGTDCVRYQNGIDMKDCLVFPLGTDFIFSIGADGPAPRPSRN